MCAIKYYLLYVVWFVVSSWKLEAVRIKFNETKDALLFSLVGFLSQNHLFMMMKIDKTRRTSISIALLIV